MAADKTPEESLQEALDLVQWLRDRLVTSLDGTKLGRAKPPFKLMSLRETLLYRIVDLGAAACELYGNGKLAAAYTLSRSSLETAAMLYWLHKKIHESVKSRELGDVDDFLMKALLGRKDKHIQPVNVKTFMQHLDKTFPGMEREYDALSEYAHPNWFGTFSLYGRLEGSKRLLLLSWPSSEARRGDGVPLLSVSLAVFQYYYQEMTRILPAFIEVCDNAIPRPSENA